MKTSDLAMTDGGIETVLVFHEGIELPDFAAFPLLYEATGRDALRRYFESFLRIAQERGLPFVLGTPTWRANRDWGQRLGYTPDALARANVDAVAFVREVAVSHPAVEILVEGVLGPRGDGYVVTNRMTADEAEAYHSEQIASLVDAGVDRISALTLTYPEEAIGVVRAARALGVPVVPSFTVEVDGSLPDGTSLGEAIELVDAATDAAAAYFMVNCAHPTHISHALDNPATADRIGALRVNASKQSHAELDEAEELDEGDPVALGIDNAALRTKLPRVQVLGGCCGTDARHVAEMIDAW
jgi:S-methylmethionine-dependent homocysteine/selenocysteine methylase